MLNIRLQLISLKGYSFLNPITISRLLLVFVLLFFVSCSQDPYLYDRAGFEYGTRPVVAPNPRAPVRVAPDYYYRQPAYPPTSHYQQNYQPYSPYQQQGYGSRGGSRYYSNPYALPAQGSYPNYDADQYYVPPTYYNNSDSQGSAGGRDTP